jgi:hypothetical protein
MLGQALALSPIATFLLTILAVATAQCKHGMNDQKLSLQDQNAQQICIQWNTGMDRT